MLGGNLRSLLYGDVSVMMCLVEAHNRTEVGFEQPTFHSVLIKFSQKASVFTVIIMFSIKSYDLDVY